MQHEKLQCGEPHGEDCASHFIITWHDQGGKLALMNKIKGHDLLCSRAKVKIYVSLFQIAEKVKRKKKKKKT